MALCNPISLTDGNPRSSTDKKPILPRKHPWNCSSATKFSQQSPGSRHKGWGRQQALLPPGHQTRNTVNSTFLTWSSHRRTCCYMHLHTHSLGNIAVGTFKKLTEGHSSIVMNATCFTTGARLAQARHTTGQKWGNLSQRSKSKVDMRLCSLLRADWIKEHGVWLFCL